MEICSVTGSESICITANNTGRHCVDETLFQVSFTLPSRYAYYIFSQVQQRTNTHFTQIRYCWRSCTAITSKSNHLLIIMHWINKGYVVRTIRYILFEIEATKPKSPGKSDAKTLVFFVQLVASNITKRKRFFLLKISQKRSIKYHGDSTKISQCIICDPMCYVIYT